MGGLGKGGGGGGGGGGGIGGGGASPDLQKSSIFAVVGSFFDQVGKIKNAVGQFFGGQGAASKGSPSSLFSSFSVVLKSYEDMLKNVSQNEVKDMAMGFIDDGKNVCQDLEKMFNNFPAQSLNETDQAQAMKSLGDLADKMKPMVTEGSKLANGMATGQGPSMGQVSGDFGGTGGNERYQAQLALANLRYAEARSDQIFGEVMKYHEEMKDLVSKMAQLNLEEINFKEILELLKQGIKILGKIREQWGKLVQFFSLVAIRAEVALNQTLVPFVKYAKEAEEMIGEGGMSKEDREFFLNLLQEQAQDINKVAYFLYTLSSTYFDVSTKFLMNRLAGLAQILATDNEAERQKLLIDLRNQANEAGEAIKVMSQQRREEYSRLVNARRRELDDMVKQLGGPSETDAKAIESVYGKQ
jgi:2-hydroxy-3-keto-5-methylthiopentenyl-1-phosphate phosphatase